MILTGRGRENETDYIQRFRYILFRATGRNTPCRWRYYSKNQCTILSKENFTIIIFSFMLFCLMAQFYIRSNSKLIMFCLRNINCHFWGNHEVRIAKCSVRKADFLQKIVDRCFDVDYCIIAIIFLRGIEMKRCSAFTLGRV